MPQSMLPILGCTYLSAPWLPSSWRHSDESDGLASPTRKEQPWRELMISSIAVCTDWALSSELWLSCLIDEKNLPEQLLVARMRVAPRRGWAHTLQDPIGMEQLLNICG